MDSRAGALLGLAGGAVALAGFALPWLNFTIDYQPLREAVGGSAGAVEEALRRGLPAPAPFSGGDYLLLLGPTGSNLEARPGVSADPFFGLRWAGMATALLPVFALLTALSSGLSLAPGRSTEPAAGTWGRIAARIRGLLRGGTGLSGGALAAISLFLLVWTGFVAPAVLPAALRDSISKSGAESLGLSPEIIGQVAGLLDRMFRFSVGPGLYLGLVGGLLGVAGGLALRRRRTTE